ncbi:recombinase family protein [Bacillus sp. NEB1478]|uniref:recombinase family protein n=1 Tax=Bacillus sp. NEB1478 TaxID=3073816 RepID=UPI002873169F|nr:recombinase family protein [Bacillus sp. NEB1478]WNB93416.1 recombinase family protein [Bacillus sp. NEB1478]
METGLAYSRKSIKIPGLSEKDSVGYQQSYLDNYGQKNKINILKHYSDVGYSGITTKRPDFQKMLNDVKTMEIHTILFFSVDRMGREIGNNISVLLEIMQHVKRIIFVSENLSTDSFHFKPMFLLLSGMSEMIRENVLKTTALGRRKKILERKTFIGSVVPTGFTKEIGDVKNAKLIPATKLNTDDQAEINGLVIVQHIFYCFLMGVSLSKIAKSLNNHFGLTNKGCLWDYSSVRYILKNVVYTGKLKGKIDGYEFYFHEDANVEPLIDPLLFEFVQNIFRYNTTGRKKQVLNRLPNFNLCKNCLSMLCEINGKIRCHVCNQSVDAQVVENIIQDALQEILKDGFSSFKWDSELQNSLSIIEFKKTKILRKIMMLEEIKSRIDLKEDSNSKKNMLEANTTELMKYKNDLFFTDEIISNLNKTDPRDLQKKMAMELESYILKLPYLIVIDMFDCVIEIVFHDKSLLKGVSESKI